QRRLEQRLGRVVPLLAIMKAPTIRSLAAHLDGSEVASRDLDDLSRRAARRRQSLIRARARGKPSGDQAAARRLFERVAAQGIELREENGRLAYSAPREAITTETLAELRANRDALLEML